MSEKKYSECLLNLPPVMRDCRNCTKLLECETGKEIAFSDMSIRDKVLKLNWVITDTREFEKMTLEELIDYNNAIKEYEKRQRMREANVTLNQNLTAGAYDRERKKWVTDILSGRDTAVDSFVKTDGLTCGYWDAEKKRWVGSKK